MDVQTRISILELVAQMRLSEIADGDGKMVDRLGEVIFDILDNSFESPTEIGQAIFDQYFSHIQQTYYSDAHLQFLLELREQRGGTLAGE